MEKVPKTLQKIHFPLGSFLSTFSKRFSLDNSQKMENLRQLVLAKNIEVGARWTQVTQGEARWTQMEETTFPPHLTNPGYCPKRPYTRMHAGHSVLPSVS